MSHRVVAQLSLADGVVARRAGQNRRLEEIARQIDWNETERLLSGIYNAREGRPAYPPLLMFKALLLQQWYGLSDPELEEALADRLSFRRFAGLVLDQQVPDYSTVSRFRAQLARLELGERLFKAVTAQLERRGLVLKRGTLIDATLVRAAVAAPPAGGRKERLGAGSALDPDAQWTHRKGGGSHFGYKAHVGVDAGSGIIREARLTGAKVNDTEAGDELISGDEGAVFADKAYDSAERRELLAKLGIADGIMRRAWWGTARHPEPQLVARNAALSRIRAGVEKVFGLMKRGYHYRRVRYRGLARNTVQLMLLCIAINLRRAHALSAA